MENYRIELVPYSDEWADDFTTAKAAIAETLAAYPHQIEHIGSTAIEGSVAKPIIDIAIKIKSVTIIPEINPLLASLSYESLGEFGLPGRHFFSKSAPKRIHLHIVDNTTDHWDRWLKFRNILRRDEDVRQEYQALKIELAEKHRFEREKYTAAKSEFINSIVDS